MSSDAPEDTTPTVSGETEAEIKELLGLFDSPAFMRRGRDLEVALDRLTRRLGLRREELLDMVRLRLRQWSAVATGPDDVAGVFDRPLGPLCDQAGGPPLAWAATPAPHRRRLAVARDLVFSVDRFNRRWGELLAGLKLDALNRQIEHYNRYYVLEKECVLGSARLAARHFSPRPPMTQESLLDLLPALPAIALVSN